MKLLRKIRNSKGSVTFIAVMMMVMLSMIGVAALKLANDEVNIAGNQVNETMAFYAAESGLEKASAELQTAYEKNGGPPSTFPAGNEKLTDATSAYVSGVDGAAENRKLTQGTLSGLNALVQTYTIESIGTSLVDAGQVTLTQNFECALVPIFQWAVYYEDDLWVEPVYDMNLDGRVHANGSMYIRTASSSATLLFEDRVTSGGNIINGFPWVGSKGDVRFTDNSGNDVSMLQGGDWIDSKRSDWYDTAGVLWGGMVQDDAFGQEELNLPIGGGNAHKLIERAGGSNSDSFENKADLKIIDGTPYSKIGGVWTDISTFISSDIIKDDSDVEFYDDKEEKWVRNTQVDVDKLAASGYYPNNGIIYISDQRNLSTATHGTVVNGTTLTNGDDLSGNPLTVACENPVYIQGDFNTTNKQPASVLCDAIYFLSNTWDYSKAEKGDSYVDRKPDITEANVCFMTGDVEADVSAKNHQGGLENLPRFLENWNGTELKIRGSMIQMWRSEQAIGDYSYKQYYTAPSRNWGFDTDLEDPTKLPPGTPQIQVFQRTSWNQENVGYTQAPTSEIDVIQ
ncbi:MAG: hypothetical protein GY865_13695 [candidate division Zixibacteria bacterium]|nr:hypothetical protein [candidate division Zixibacteria bacterium]